MFVYKILMHWPVLLVPSYSFQALAFTIRTPIVCTLTYYVAAVKLQYCIYIRYRTMASKQKHFAHAGGGPTRLITSSGVV